MEEKILYNLKHINGHYLLKNNIISNEIQSEAFSINIGLLKSKKISTYEWHQILAHAFNESIQHFSSIAEEMKIFNKNASMFRIN